MVVETIGDLVNFKEAAIIAHQTNYHGVMGAGVALAIKNKLLTTEAYLLYQRVCADCGENLLGTVQFLSTRDGKRCVANLFCQDERLPGLATDYAAMYRAMAELRAIAEHSNLSVAMPGKIGCGIAGGSWDAVRGIIHDVFDDSKITCYIVYWDREVQK